MSSNLAPTKEELLWMYDRMALSRAYERMMDRCYMEGKAPVFDMAKGPVPGEMHLERFECTATLPRGIADYFVSNSK